MPSMLQVAGVAHAARSRRSKGVLPLLLLPVSRQLGTSHWTPARLRLGPAQPVSQSQPDIRVAGPGVWPGGAAAAGNETPDAGQAPARASSAGHPINLISESPGPGCGPGRRQLGKRHRTLAWLRFGSASARLGSAARGLRAGETGTRLPVSHPTRASHPSVLTAPPVRRAVSTASVLAVCRGQDCGTLRGGGSGSWPDG